MSKNMPLHLWRLWSKRPGGNWLATDRYAASQTAAGAMQVFENRSDKYPYNYEFATFSVKEL